VLIMPAIVALVASNFGKPERPRAYGSVAAAGASVALLFAPLACSPRSQSEEVSAKRLLGDGETRTRTGDTTIFSRYARAVRRREIPARVAVLATRLPNTEVPKLRALLRG
jgi:hypothetical protein